MGDVVSSILFQPPQAVRCLKASKVTWLKTKNNFRIPSVFIANKTAKITLLYSHANAEDLADVYVWLKYLSKQLNVNVMGYDYTGYGQSEGEPAEEHCYADIDAVYEHLTTVRGLKPSQIVLFGRSLGSGPSCYLASKTSAEGNPVAGLILHSPFTSIYRVVADVGCTLSGDKFPNIDFAPDIKCSVLFIHGTADKIIPHSHSESLSNAIDKQARIPPFLLDGMGHNSIPEEYRPLVLEKVRDFLLHHTNVDPSKFQKGKAGVSAIRSTTQASLPSKHNIALDATADTDDDEATTATCKEVTCWEESIFDVYVKALHEQWVEVQNKDTAATTASSSAAKAKAR
uniref:AB hydrolase-1 domain-containing protein n=1 Tax=Leptocylindrus danicus TaxID=163516 RepID=A0A7S2K4G4_9STRA|eukprot:CAMPEP_0116010222 /NCGR_PEP_ID=MMETSP0321-20121206/3880_1 /TAXON_ID=163516 /ORGANISM="Leptocylindrus danicus var. danicus, Strain B650" /LENGTH=342 /DNA_ID=CAMNT_0003479295 /DNA_START=1 /DNA_END=1029 /DNA_ORIENTATION=+